jgi:hypothetical protein
LGGSEGAGGAGGAGGAEFEAELAKAESSSSGLSEADGGGGGGGASNDCLGGDKGAVVVVGDVEDELEELLEFDASGVGFPL